MAFLELGFIFYQGFLAKSYRVGYGGRAMPVGAPPLVYNGFLPICTGVVL